MEKIKLLAGTELDKVDEILSGILVEEIEVNESIKDLLCSNSKRVRTIVTSLFLKANGCKLLSSKSLNIIAAGEIIHNASLLHDDVLDGATTRRGKPAFCEIYSPHMSILMGDYLLSVATENLLNINNNKILQIFLSCTQKMCNAEIKQYFLRGKLPDIDEYIVICEGKTASLFNAIMESCAIVEGVEISNEFARDFGILFQLKNDLLLSSEVADRQNMIYTARDILGIEKAMALVDNYLVKIRKEIRKLPDNEYKEGLEILLENL